MEPEPVIECQDCGTTIRHLTPSEARQVAERPYDFVAYCRECTRNHSLELR